MNETVSYEKPVVQADDMKTEPPPSPPECEEEESSISGVAIEDKCENDNGTSEAKHFVIIPILPGIKAPKIKTDSDVGTEKMETELVASALSETVKPTSPGSSSDLVESKVGSPEPADALNSSHEAIIPVTSNEESDKEALTPSEESLPRSEKIEPNEPNSKANVPALSVVQDIRPESDLSIPSESVLLVPSDSKSVCSEEELMGSVQPDPDSAKPVQIEPEPVKSVQAEVNLSPKETPQNETDHNPQTVAVQGLVQTESDSETRIDKNGKDTESTDDCDMKEKDVASMCNIYMKKCNANEMIKRLDEIDPGHKLRSLCKKGDAAALEEFLKGDVDLNVVSDEGWTCLHEIITHECQFTEIARILLSHGASVNTQDLHGDSPLHSCLLYHCTENIKLLLNHGADLELTNSSGRKPIHVANDEESLKLLLDHGANVNAADNMGNTCLHYAVVAKDKDRVKLLLSAKYKSDVSVKNASGSTPLHLASEPEIASLLLDSAADANAVDLAGNSPLHLAVRGRHKEVVRHLLEKKADPNLTNTHGKAPVSLAKDREMKNILSGKVSSPTATNGVNASMSVTPTAIQSRKRPYSPSIESSSPTSATAGKETPSSILKKVRRVSIENGERTSRLRFSDVNEYNCIDGDQCLSKRVKVRPIYSEPTFSSDDEF